MVFILSVVVLFIVNHIVPIFSDELVKYEHFPNDPITGETDFKYSYQTNDGTIFKETRTIGREDKNNLNEQLKKVSGSYSFKTPEGLTQTVTYEADENGFRSKFSLRKVKLRTSILRIGSQLTASLIGGGLG